MFLVIILVLIGTYIWTSVSRRYEYFDRHGIPGPPPQFLFGHLRTLWKVPFYSRQLQEWTRQYGSIYGLYEGTRPLYVVSDVDFLQQVYITQFSSFHSRRSAFITRLSESSHLFASKGERWRLQRHVINPSFSAAKLKGLSMLVIDCVEIFMSKLSEMDMDVEERELDIYPLYNRFMLDVILFDYCRVTPKW